MTYAEQLKDPRWQKRRLEIMQRDNFKCVFCKNGKKTLNVHHKNYRRGSCLWEYGDVELITLCEDCHEEIEILLRHLSWLAAYSKEDMRTLQECASCISLGLGSQLEMVCRTIAVSFRQGVDIATEKPKRNPRTSPKR